MAALRIIATGALGAFSGALGGLFGIGGGVIAIPLLGMLYGLSQQSAQGTTLVMVVPNVLLGFWRYRQRVGLDLRIAAALGLSSLATTCPVARIATGLDPHGLRLAYAAFLILLAGSVAWGGRRGLSVRRSDRPRAWGWALVGAAGGVISGAFGVGGAFIAPPALTRFFGLRQIEAQGLALALVCPSTVVALGTYASAGQVDWAVGLPLACGGIAAISAGIALAQRFSDRWVQLGFCLLLLVTAALLAAHG